MDVQIDILKDFSIKKSTLICGLPGIAYIGKLSIDYLVKELKAELIGEIYSKYFPPYVLIRKDGLVELLRNELYYFKNDNQDFLFFTGNAQASSPEGQFLIVDKVLDKVLSLGVKRVYSIAAFLTNRSFKTPKVYGTTTDPALIDNLEKYGVLPMDHGIISGMNGLIFGLAKRKKMEGICLLGETRGYRTTTGQYLLDSKAVKEILKILTEILDLKVNMEPLDKQTEQMDDFIKRMSEIESQARDELHETFDRSKQYIT
jgi:uncharacterized protein (TIGR00162 family)